MPRYVPPTPTVEEIRENLRKDGGRKVMDGGNPYEDDVESDGGADGNRLRRGPWGQR